MQVRMSREWNMFDKGSTRNDTATRAIIIDVLMLSTLEFGDASTMTVVQGLPAAPQTVSPFVILYTQTPRQTACL